RWEIVTKEKDSKDLSEVHQLVECWQVSLYVLSLRGGPNDYSFVGTTTIAKGPETTTWIWNLHADAHDFDSHTSDLEEISRKNFSALFGQLSIIFLWLSGMNFHSA
ncbi:hypothetical protein RDABS01_001193, partial [Bienertia sinuspersici]